MLRRLALAALAALLFNACEAQPADQQIAELVAHDRILLAGDSETAQGLISTLIDVPLSERFASLAPDLWPVGLTGALCLGISQNFALIDRDVNPTTIILECGVNDTQYGAWTMTRQTNYSNGLGALINAAKAAHPTVPIYVLSIPPIDGVPAAHAGDAATINAAIVQYNVAGAAKAAALGVTWLDLYTPVKAAYDGRAACGSSCSAWSMTSDGVHATSAGAKVWSEAILSGIFGLTSSISTAAFDVAGCPPVSACYGCSLASVSMSGTSVSFSRTDQAVPEQFETPTMAGAAFALPYVPGFAARNALWLRITSLTSGTYAVTIDSASAGSFSAAQLAAGVDLSMASAFHAPSQTISATIRSYSYEITSWRYQFLVQSNVAGFSPSDIAYWEAHGRMDDRDNGFDGVLALHRAAINAAAQPVAHSWAITRTGP